MEDYCWEALFSGVFGPAPSIYVPHPRLPMFALWSLHTPMSSVFYFYNDCHFYLTEFTDWEKMRFRFTGFYEVGGQALANIPNDYTSITFTFISHSGQYFLVASVHTTSCPFANCSSCSSRFKVSLE